MNEEKMQDIGYMIKKTHGVDRVAERAGVPRRSVLKFCNNYAKVTMRDLDRIVRAVEAIEAEEKKR